MHVRVAYHRLNEIICVLLCMLLFGCNQESKALNWYDVEQLIQSRFSDVPSITTDALASALADGRPILLLDVREVAEYAVSHLQGALHVASIEEAEILLEMARPDALVVAYCSVGYRSAAFIQSLREAGVTNAVNLKGAMFAWANEGQAIYRGNVKVKHVHPFDKLWGSLLDRELWAFEPTVTTAP